MTTDWIDSVRWDSDGLVPAIAQDDATGDVLMMAWMDREALLSTVASGQAVYFSRSRQRLWPKGESSGHTQSIVSIRLDCDADVILLLVEQKGGIACHTGRRRCFYRELIDNSWHVSDEILRNPDEIYATKDDKPAQ